ncbi:MAG TPA: hypothetical protein VKA34_13445 [Balneolales bacterium]|nr:hypothetical protein [Balneolales bacterium]
MKELTIAEIENIEGGSTESVLCGAAFAQFGLWNSLALGLAEVSLGTSLAVGIAIDAVGLAVCSQA